MTPSSGPGVKKRRSKRQKRLEDSEQSSKVALIKEMDKELNELMSHVSRLQTCISDEETDLEKLVKIIIFNLSSSKTFHIFNGGCSYIK